MKPRRGIVGAEPGAGTVGGGGAGRRGLAALGIALAWLPATLALGQMVPIPAGTFVMGRDDGPADERPAHPVSVPAFHLDRLPVTNAQFAGFLEAVGAANARGDSLFDPEDPDARIRRHEGRWMADPGFEHHPVVEVSWAGARDYCAWRGGRLPTEAEWEYAARGSDGRRHPWGEAPPDPARARFGASYNATASVDAFPAGASPFGILGMAGNVWQWVSSAYRPYPYRPDDGREDRRDPERERVTRGGGHDSPAEDLVATHRGRHVSRRASAGHHNIGFRCAR